MLMTEKRYTENLTFKKTSLKAMVITHAYKAS